MAQKMDFTNLKKQIENCCLTIDDCGKCDGGDCCIYYCKQVIGLYEKKGLRLIPKGMDKVPNLDMKIYDQHEITRGIAECLAQCKQCKSNHMKNCTINVIRSSLERTLLGDNVEDYMGTVLQHVMELTKINSEIGISILDYYNEIKNRG